MTPRLICTMALVLVTSAGCAHRGLTATTYSSHTTFVPSGDGPTRAAMEALRAEWTADVLTIGGRTRMDITSGGQPGMFVKGDYILTDTVDYIVVRPSSKTFFVRPPPDVRGVAGSPSQTSGLKTTVTNISVQVDSGERQVVAGLPARKYTLSISYMLSVDVSAIIPQADLPTQGVRTTITNSFWYAESRPAHSAGRADVAASLTYGPLQDLRDSIAAVSRALPTTRLLVRMVATTRVAASTAESGTERTYEIRDLRRTQVTKPSSFEIPGDYIEMPFPGIPASMSRQHMPTDGGIRWRAHPPGK
jgi:hypothetical protein